MERSGVVAAKCERVAGGASLTAAHIPPTYDLEGSRGDAGTLPFVVSGKYPGRTKKKGVPP